MRGAAALQGSAVGGGGSYLITEGFEAGTEPSGWSNSSAVYNFTPALVGNFSLHIPAAGNSETSSFSSQAALNVFFTIKFGANPGSSANAISLRDPTGVTVVGLEYRSSGALHLITDSGNQAVSITGPTPGTQYFYWIDFTQGSGSNEVANLYTSTTTTKPGSPDATITNGTSTLAIDHIRFFGPDTSDTTWDYLRVSQTTIGSAPT